jgi:carbon storage regulator
MLVLTRKTDETIYIGEEITITITRIGPTSVRVGIEAPASYDIKRGEHFSTVAAEDCLADRVTIKTEDN